MSGEFKNPIYYLQKQIIETLLYPDCLSHKTMKTRFYHDYAKSCNQIWFKLHRSVKQWHFFIFVSMWMLWKCFYF